MKRIEILGKTIGKIYVKEYVGGHNTKYICVCPCGEEYVAASNSIRAKKTDCGCGAVTGIHKKPFKVGDMYKGSKILEIGKIYGKKTFYTFKCAKCGGNSGRVHAGFLKFPLCKECLKREMAENTKEKRSTEFSGKTVNGIKILDISGQGEDGAYCVAAICPVCGEEFETKLSRIKSGIGSCDKCAEKNLEAGKKIVKDAAVEGTCIIQITNRALNRNSTTGHKGVSLLPSGKYRAYIYFKRKQYYLGLYESVEDAAEARAKAEKEIYGNFLKWYEETYPDQWEKINRKNKVF